MQGNTSKFECTICGECCRGSQKVWMNPLDMERLARFLKLKGSDGLIEGRIAVMEAGEHGISRPRLLFPMTPAGRACRFLINHLDEDGRLWGKCSLHESGAKPLVCRLAPLSREIDLTDGSEIWIEIPPVAGCPGWSVNPPPPDGQSISPPDLGAGLRSDLDSEREYFRELSGL